MFCAFFTTKAQDEIFEKLSDTKDVNVVYISRGMLQMMPNMRASGMDFGKIAEKLNSITILSGEETKSVQTIKDEMKNVVKKGNYEQTMFIKDEDSKTVFYSRKKNPKDENVSEILMIMEEDDEITVIRITGDNINPSDLRNMRGGKPFSMMQGSSQQSIRITQKQREQAQKVREEAQKQREEALKQAQKQREEAQKQREKALKDAEKRREEAKLKVPDRD